MMEKGNKLEYEFMGPIGAAILIFILPIVTACLYLSCNINNGCVTVSDIFSKSNDYEKLQLLLKTMKWSLMNEFFSFNALAVVVAWIVFQAVLTIILPGKWVEGLPIDSKGTRLLYKINGLLAYVVSLAIIFTSVFLGIIPATYAYDNFTQLLGASTLVAFTLSIYLFISSFLPYSGQLAKGGNSGNIIYDFFIGRELNPRIGSFDLKVFFELRPGLIGWVMIDLSLAAADVMRNGSISHSMAMVVVFHAWYVFDALWSESAVLSTMDVINDGFGWMLAYGDLVWVPFTYTVQVRYFVDFPVTLSWSEISCMILLHMIGFYIFRGANSQKNAFRSDPFSESCKHLKYMRTKRGTPLLVSGWWGMSRHINYFGDWIMGLTWCLPAGRAHVIPYFYALYFAILLIHRERRDDHNCRSKYGEDWDRYCTVVPWRIVPYIY